MKNVSLVKSAQRNRKIFVLSELDCITTVRGPYIILKNMFNPGSRRCGECGEASELNHGAELLEEQK